METNFTSGANRMWIYNTDPDSEVHNSFSVYAETGEIFMNTVTKDLFFCSQGGTEQTWKKFTFDS